MTAAADLRTERRLGESRGSGTVLAVGVIAAMLSILGTSLTSGAILVSHAKVSVAADVAALAAADALAGFTTEEPCRVATRAAELSGARLADCRLEGAEALVRVEAQVGGLIVAASARAGPTR